MNELTLGELPFPNRRHLRVQDFQNFQAANGMLLVGKSGSYNQVNIKVNRLGKVGLAIVSHTHEQIGLEF